MKKRKTAGLSAMCMVLCLMLTACSSADSEGTEGTEGTENTETNYSTEFYLSEYLDEDGYLKDVDFAKAVTLPDYKSVVVPKEHYTPGDLTLQLEIEELLSGYSTKETVTEGVVEDGDTLNIDYVGSIGGVEFAGGSTNGNGTEVTIGVTQYIDDFLQQLIGHKVGENFDIEVTFPENYGNEDLNGKDAVFETTINFIVETETPELTDEFVKENLEEAYGYTSVEDMKSKLKESMTRSKKENYAWEYILENSEFETLP